MDQQMNNIEGNNVILYKGYIKPYILNFDVCDEFIR